MREPQFLPEAVVPVAVIRHQDTGNVHHASLPPAQSSTVVVSHYIFL